MLACICYFVMLLLVLFVSWIFCSAAVTTHFIWQLSFVGGACMSALGTLVDK